MNRFLISIAFLFFFSVSCHAETTVEFLGFPVIKIQEGGIDRIPSNVLPEKRGEFQCIINKVGEKYYWASRENKEMIKIDSGKAFITYIALDGAGYVKVLKPEYYDQVLDSPVDAAFEYIEHMSIGLTTITYFGNNPNFPKKK